MAVGWRYNRKDRFSKKIASRLANFLRSKFLSDSIHDSGCSLKAFKKEVAQDIVFHKGMHRFIPALAIMKGYKIKEVKVEHEKRKSGTTKYKTFLRGIPGLIDMLGVFWLKKRKLTYKVDEII
jgi:dolichol-phosphate mannosyltransferase